MKSMRELLDVGLNEMAVTPMSFSNKKQLNNFTKQLEKKQLEFVIDYTKTIEEYFDEKLRLRDVDIFTTGGVSSISIIFKENIKNKRERGILQKFRRDIINYLVESYSAAGWAGPNVDIWWTSLFSSYLRQNPPPPVGPYPKKFPEPTEPKKQEKYAATQISIKIVLQQPTPPEKEIDIDWDHRKAA